MVASRPYLFGCPLRRRSRSTMWTGCGSPCPRFLPLSTIGSVAARCGTTPLLEPGCRNTTYSLIPLRRCWRQPVISSDGGLEPTRLTISGEGSSSPADERTGEPPFGNCALSAGTGRQRTQYPSDLCDAGRRAVRGNSHASPCWRLRWRDASGQKRPMPHPVDYWPWIASLKSLAHGCVNPIRHHHPGRRSSDSSTTWPWRFSHRFRPPLRGTTEHHCATYGRCTRHGSLPKCWRR